MKPFQSLLPAFGLVTAARAWNNWSNSSSEVVTWTTVTTDIYTTVCPSATTFTQGTKTYTATESETLTITDCPCTYSKPVTTWTPAPPKSSQVPPPANSTYVPPPVWTTTVVVSSLTTYCPAPTSVVQGNKTYTVTEATTLTITNCPCTVKTTLPATVVTSTMTVLTTYCPAPTTITYGSSTYPVTTPGSVTIPICTTYTTPVTSPAPPATSGGITTSVASTNTHISSSSPTTSGPIQVTGNAAVKLDAGIGAIAAAAAGLAALM